MEKCSQCGVSLSRSAEVCPDCGAKLEEESDVKSTALGFPSSPVDDAPEPSEQTATGDKTTQLGLPTSQPEASSEAECAESSSPEMIDWSEVDDEPVESDEPGSGLLSAWGLGRTEMGASPSESAGSEEREEDPKETDVEIPAEQCGAKEGASESVGDEISAPAPVGTGGGTPEAYRRAQDLLGIVSGLTYASHLVIGGTITGFSGGLLGVVLALSTVILGATSFVLPATSSGTGIKSLFYLGSALVVGGLGSAIMEFVTTGSDLDAVIAVAGAIVAFGAGVTPALGRLITRG